MQDHALRSLHLTDTSDTLSSAHLAHLRTSVALPPGMPLEVLEFERDLRCNLDTVTGNMANLQHSKLRNPEAVSLGHCQIRLVADHVKLQWFHRSELSRSVAADSKEVRQVSSRVGSVLFRNLTACFFYTVLSVQRRGAGWPGGYMRWMCKRDSSSAYRAGRLTLDVRRMRVQHAPSTPHDHCRLIEPDERIL